MSNNHQEFYHIIKKVEDAETNNFCELASLLGRNPKIDFAGSNLSHTDLSGCDLSHADLSHADLSNANLRRCNLAHSNLRHSNLSSCDMENANLQGADLAHADLTNCNLTNVNLDSVDLSLVDLSLIRPQEPHHDEFDIETKEPQKPEVKLLVGYERRMYKRHGYQRFFERRKKSRVNLLGVEVLKYVRTVIAPRKVREAEWKICLPYVKYFIAKNHLSPPCIIVVQAYNGRVLKYFWDEQGLFSYRYVVENFALFPHLQSIYNRNKDAMKFATIGDKQEKGINKPEL